MSSLVLLNACPTPCNLCTRQRNLRFPAWKNCTKRTSLRFPIWGGIAQVGAPKVRVVDALSRLEELHQANKLTVSYLEELHQANKLALSYLDHSTRQSFGGYIVGLSGNSFAVDLHAALIDHAARIAGGFRKTGIGNELR